MLKPSEIVIRITQDVPTINKITFRACCQPGENAECICTKTELGEPACWRSNGEYVCTYVVRHNDITSFVTKINLENIFYVGLESSRKHNNYVFGKNKDWGGSLKLLFIFFVIYCSATLRWLISTQPGQVGSQIWLTRGVFMTPNCPPILTNWTSYLGLPALS